MMTRQRAELKLSRAEMRLSRHVCPINIKRVRRWRIRVYGGEAVSYPVTLRFSSMSASQAQGNANRAVAVLDGAKASLWRRLAWYAKEFIWK